MLTGAIIGLGLWLLICTVQFGLMRDNERTDWPAVFGKALVFTGLFGCWGFIGSLVF